jgi:hypothetical protein
LLTSSQAMPKIPTAEEYEAMYGGGSGNVSREQAPFQEHYTRGAFDAREAPSGVSNESYRDKPLPNEPVKESSTTNLMKALGRKVSMNFGSMRDRPASASRKRSFSPTKYVRERSASLAKSFRNKSSISPVKLSSSSRGPGTKSASPRLASMFAKPATAISPKLEPTPEVNEGQFTIHPVYRSAMASQDSMDFLVPELGVAVDDLRYEDRKGKGKEPSK